MVQRLNRVRKEKVNADFGKKISAKYVEIKKLFWREVKREIQGGNNEACRIMSDEVIVKRNEGI